MDYIQKYKKRVFSKIFLWFVVGNVITVVAGYTSVVYFKLDDLYAYGLLISIILSYGLIISQAITNAISRPLDTISQTVSYASNNSRDMNQPDQNNAKIARELIHSLSMEIYNLAATTATETTEGSSETQVAPTDQVVAHQFIDQLGIPIVGLDKDQKITRVNRAACDYVNLPADKMIGEPMYDVFKFSFQSDESLDSWIQKSKNNTITAVRSWDRVRHVINQDEAKQFDLVASFSANNSSGTETTLALYDQTHRYNQDDQEITFVALAVHELRTPLTIMRGYIEVFEDELGPTLQPEMTDFMHKMHASAQQLAAFVSNILNVARIEENQLELRLRSVDLPAILKSAVADLELRASVHDKRIELNVSEGIPAVAGERVSIHEIINNLVDNAIKYSGTGDKIVLSCQVNQEGQVEVSVQDFGIGIPQAVVGELFQKFHRSHKSKVQVGGTGLGLYLCKALVRAHGGNIWVRSKEGEGSIFSFTLVPFDQLTEEQVSGEDGIIRGAHGWIKNHSMYRG